MASGKVTLNIESEVTVTHQESVLTGIFCDQEEHTIKGWQWDRRVLEDKTDIKTLYGDSLAVFEHGLEEGTRGAEWLSGTASGTEFLRAVNKRLYMNTFGWVPEVLSGRYSVVRKEKNLYSDNSVTSIPAAAGQTEYTIKDGGDILEECLLPSLSFVLYRRSRRFVNIPFASYTFVESFSQDGNANNERLEEFTISEVTVNDETYDVATLNKSPDLAVGDTLAQGELPDISCLNRTSEYLEYLGVARSGRRRAYLEFFPVRGDEFRLFAKVENVITELNPVSPGQPNAPGDAPILKWDPQASEYLLDEDLGVIDLPGEVLPTLFLKEDIAAGDTEIAVITTANKQLLNNYPSNGYIVIGAEEILYREKTSTGFSGCTRGVNNTQPAAHNRGSEINSATASNGLALAEGAELYAVYTATPRIEYEVRNNSEKDKFKRTANRSPLLGVDGLRNFNTNSIIQIDPTELHVSKLVLETDLPPIGESDINFGPLYYGTDTSRLTARALDTNDNPVSDVDITIEVIEGSARLNNSPNTYTDRSNSLGEIYAVLHSEYNWENISQEGTWIAGDGNLTPTLRLQNALPTSTQPKDIQIYQRLKHDPYYAIDGYRFPIVPGSINNTVPPGPPSIQLENGVELFGPDENHDIISYFDIASNEPFPEDLYGCAGGIGEDGMPTHPIAVPYQINNGLPSGIMDPKEIIKVIELYDSPDNTGDRIGFRVFLNGGLSQTATEVRLLPYNTERFDPKHPKYAEVVLYYWSNTAKRPGAEDLGAYIPVIPEDVTGQVLSFGNLELKEPKADKFYENLAGYTVVSPGTILVQARCQDPATGKVLLSNKIRIRINLPKYLRGISYENEALPIPYGFGFVSGEVDEGNEFVSEYGTGFGGMNFLTINPNHDGLGMFHLQIDANTP